MTQEKPYFVLHNLLASLTEAADGVVKVAHGGYARGTGWLITDDLVVVPWHVLGDVIDSTPFRCQRSGPDMPLVEADIVFVPEERSPDRTASSPESLMALSAPALLRLRGSLGAGRPMRLARDSAVGDTIFALHYPLQVPDLAMSFGEALAMHEGLLTHSAATSAGSSGGPIVNREGEVLAMTTVRAPGGSASGPVVAAILNTLRDASAWPEISAFHNLADLTSVRERLSERPNTPSADVARLLRWVAVRWSFDPDLHTDEDREHLASLVHDARAERWILRSRERGNLISAATLPQLREARGPLPIREDARQTVFDRILQGPPFSLDEIDESVLPHWLQAVRWFADAVPGLPTPAEVTDALERRRLRGRLAAVAGPDFRGRNEELTELREWYEGGVPAPMVVTGIGGIGKSALLARFAQGLPEETLLCWLDFDRADLAPDDADSVLAQLAHQIAIQADDFTPDPVGTAQPWQLRASVFAVSLAIACRQRPAPLLVLDGFEIAQHVRRHGELWLVLEAILREVPRLRVIVSGRAAVPGLRLLGEDAVQLSLRGLAREDAAAWLSQHGVSDPEILERVLDLAGGIPLALHLAVRFVAGGGTVADLPVHLPQAMVEGLLYTRILERVMDPELMVIARDALVLRRLTVEIVAEVLGGDADVFDRLTRELSLVDEGLTDQLDLAVGSGEDELRLRPEVRAAALALLEIDDSARVRALDVRAAAWYRRRDNPTVADMAELVYHRLRLGDVVGAGFVWRDSCAPALAGAGDELPPSARRWLNQRITGKAAEQAAWERDAHMRIRRAMGRGNERAAAEILGERTARDDRGPLIFYDAWLRWQQGNVDGARFLLAGSRAEGRAGRNREVLAARLAVERDDRAAADRHLAGIQAREHWGDFSAAGPMACLVWAARVRLTVDLDSEYELLRQVRALPALGGVLAAWLHPFDVVLGELSTALGPQILTGNVPIPQSVSELGSFADRLGEWRAVGPLRPTERGLIERWAADDRRWGVPDGAYSQVGGYTLLPMADFQLAVELAVLGQRRTNLATADLSLRRLCELADRASDGPATLVTSAVAALAAYRCLPLAFSGEHSRFGNLDDLLLERAFNDGVALRPHGSYDSFAAVLLGDLASSRQSEAERHALELYVRAPDPLDLLVRTVAGLPIRED